MPKQMPKMDSLKTFTSILIFEKISNSKFFDEKNNFENSVIFFLKIFKFCKGKLYFSFEKYFSFFKGIFSFPFWKFSDFQKIFFWFSKWFFSSKFFEVEKKSNINIDVKVFRESIFGIYFGIRALLMPPSEFLLLFSVTGIEAVPPREMAWFWQSIVLLYNFL